MTGPAGQRHRVALLALLASAWPQAVSRERAMALLWPEQDDAHARRLLNLAVHVLRRALGEGSIVSAADGLLVEVGGGCDLHAFRAALAAGDHAGAVAAYSGPFLDGFSLSGAIEYQYWVDERRAELAHAFEGALQRLAESCRECGDVHGWVGACRRLAGHDPYSGSHARGLMEALASTGERAAAIRHGQEHCRRLRNELELEADVETSVLLRRLESEAAAPPRSARRARGPEPGRGRDGDVEEARMECARGRYFCGKREASALEKALVCFERARSLAPWCSEAHTGMASAYALMGFYDLMAPRQAFSLARQAAQTALALNPADPDGHASLGYIAKYFDWHWAGAERELQEAIQLDPINPLAHQWFGNYLVLRGESGAAIASMQRAVRLAPESAIATAATGWACYFAGEYERAIDYCLVASELDAQLPMAHAWRGQALQELGRHAEAVAALRTSVALLPSSAAFQASLAQAMAVAGDRDLARATLRGLMQRRRIEYVPSFELAKVHLALGESGRALHLLESAWRERSHSMGLLRVDPQLRPLHDVARFQRLVASVGA